tara:strand:+ start:655 stop:1263 length:609 start_codon:yes stop_codon:yes gene_type:complete
VKDKILKLTNRSKKIAGNFTKGFGVVSTFFLLVGFDAPWLSRPEPFEAPFYVPSPSLESKVKLVDNGDGTMSHRTLGKMWAKADSYAIFGRCLDYYESKNYVEKLNVGGYTDWRIPDMEELASLYDNTKNSVITWDHDKEYPLSLNEKFADGAAYWYWSIGVSGSKLTDCCAQTLYFVNGVIHTRRLSSCKNGGVRAVRDVR